MHIVSFLLRAAAEKIRRHRHGQKFIEFLKFCSVGFLNLGIDFAVLNVLSFLTKVYAGPFVIVLNTLSFAAAVTNSYLLNKRWTFRHAAPHSSKEFSKFIAVNIGGSAINSGVVFAFTTFIPPFGMVHPQLWLNIGKIVALPLSTLWNFLGSKFLVFRHPTVSLKNESRS